LDVENPPMIEVAADNAVEYARAAGLLPVGVAARVEGLAWGVSNIVLRVCPETGPEFVLKQSREQLRTRAEWRSRLDRIWREIDVQRIVGELLPEGIVPAVLFEDRPNYLYAMEAIERGHRVWKQVLLDGEVDLELAETLADYLARVHSGTWRDDMIAARFGDTQAFDELRLDPYYRYLARRLADVEAPMQRLVESTIAHPRCLVLGDFSPKNILVTSGGVALVDFETGHYGDPAFDVGFFLSHITLKGIRAGRGAGLFEFARRWWEAYFGRLRPAVDVEDLEARSVLHWAGCMLARVDGKSPVDYLDQSRQDTVRTLTRSLLNRPLATFDAAWPRVLGD
jgi:5-methylthioribose kinase